MNKQVSDKDEVKNAKNQGPRPYGCPCGKFYLSYPALFTHVKQKHGGKAPGDLIKPESGKVRGRPKSKTINEQSFEENIPKILEAIGQIIEETELQYTENFLKSEGKQTCQDIASIFLEQFTQFSPQKLRVIQCFLNELKYHVGLSYGDQHWEISKASQLINLANDIYLQHENVMDKFPLSEQTLKELLFQFFEWMYANKFTDHRLVKKNENDVTCD